jgi:HlyD family secretion protein
MTANVSFTVSQSENVLKIANAALRFRPSDKSQEEIQKLMATLPSRRTREESKGQQNAPDARPAGAFRPQTVEAAGPAGAERGARSDGQARDGTGSGIQGQRSGNGMSGMGGSFRMGGGGRMPGMGSRGGGALAEIGPSLHDQFGIIGGMKIRFPNAENPRPVWNLVWVLDNQGKPQPRKALLGITDGRETAVVTGELKEGDQVITADLNDIQQSPTAQGSSPFRSPMGGMGGGPRRTGGR